MATTTTTTSFVPPPSLLRPKSILLSSTHLQENTTTRYLRPCKGAVTLSATTATNAVTAASTAVANKRNEETRRREFSSPPPYDENSKKIDRGEDTITHDVHPRVPHPEEDPILSKIYQVQQAVADKWTTVESKRAQLAFKQEALSTRETVLQKLRHTLTDHQAELFKTQVQVNTTQQQVEKLSCQHHALIQRQWTLTRHQAHVVERNRVLAHQLDQEVARNQSFLRDFHTAVVSPLAPPAISTGSATNAFSSSSHDTPSSSGSILMKRQRQVLVAKQTRLTHATALHQQLEAKIQALKTSLASKKKLVAEMEKKEQITLARVESLS